MAIGSGLTACLNIETGEVVTWIEEPIIETNRKLHYHNMPQKAKLWSNKVVIDSMSPIDQYEMRQNFLDEKVREGTRLYGSLERALLGPNPLEDFDSEVKKRKGEVMWKEYLEWYLLGVVKQELESAIVGDRIVLYPINDDTIELMAQAHIDGKYCYWTGDLSHAIISQVVYQNDMAPDGEWMTTIDTYYSITEQLWQRAETHKFYELGGGSVIQPHGIYDVQPLSDDERPTLEDAILEIEEMLDDAMEEEWDSQELHQICHDEKMVEDLFDSLDLEEYGDEAPSANIDGENASRNRHKKSQTQSDDKYPRSGAPDDVFTV